MPRTLECHPDEWRGPVKILDTSVRRYEARLPRCLLRGALFALILLSGLFTFNSINAAPLLYTAEVPVNSQSDTERVEALKVALAQVVMQVTGDKSVLARINVAKAVAEADKYVLQYQYRQEPSQPNEGNDPAAPAFQLMLLAQFDRNAVDQLLQRTGMAAVSNETSIAVPTTPTEFRLWVNYLRSAEDYARVMGYFRDLEPVHEIQALQAHGDGVLLKLNLTMDLHRFLEMVDAGGTLHVGNSLPTIEAVDASLELIP